MAWLFTGPAVLLLSVILYALFGKRERVKRKPPAVFVRPEYRRQ